MTTTTQRDERGWRYQGNRGKPTGFLPQKCSLPKAGDQKKEAPIKQYADMGTFSKITKKCCSLNLLMYIEQNYMSREEALNDGTSN